jgi:phosphoglycolate phosphatase-like HAD superfamily hydrolase
VSPAGPAGAVAIDLDRVLADTGPLWRDWLSDVARRGRVDVAALRDDREAAAAELDRVLGNWPDLLERFAEDHVPVYVRPAADISAALRRLEAAGVRIGAFTDAPEPLARVVLAHLGVARRLEAVEAGAGAFERLLGRLGPRTTVVRAREELLRLA